MLRISQKNKSIIESLSLFIQNHSEHAPELISKLANELCNVEFKDVLVESDKHLLNIVVKASLTYCTATYSLNQYPKFIQNTSVLMLSNLITGVLQFNQRTSLAGYMNELITSIRNTLPTSSNSLINQDVRKVEALIKMFNFEFDINYFYDCAIKIHHDKLEEINHAAK